MEYNSNTKIKDEQSKAEKYNQQIIGFVRYSLKEYDGDWKTSITDMVFDEKYFSYRFRLFNDITLKSFQNQTDKDFVLFLMHSVNMPQIFKEQMKKLEEENSFLKNVYLEDNKEAFNEYAQNLLRQIGNTVTVITFRIDNDDGVPFDFIKRLREYAGPAFAGHVITMPKVYKVQRIKKDTYSVVESYYPCNSVGMAYVMNPDDKKTVFEIGKHHVVRENFPLISFAGNIQGGLISINGKNVINNLFSFNRVEQFLGNFDAIEINELICEHFNLDLDCLHVVRKKITRSLFHKVFFMLKNRGKRKNTTRSK